MRMTVLGSGGWIPRRHHRCRGRCVTSADHPQPSAAGHARAHRCGGPGPLRRRNIGRRPGHSGALAARFGHNRRQSPISRKELSPLVDQFFTAVSNLGGYLAHRAVLSKLSHTRRQVPIIARAHVSSRVRREPRIRPRLWWETCSDPALSIAIGRRRRKRDVVGWRMSPGRWWR